jgi:PBP1b-binding outer membrane lipoprotein LpoB
MKNQRHGLTRIVLGSAFLLLVGCVSNPTVKDAKVLVPRTEKSTTMQLVFLDLPMTKNSPSCKSCAPQAYHPPELVNFSNLLNQAAKSAFAKRNVSLARTKIVDDVSEKFLDSPVQEDGVWAPVLVLAPLSGTTSTYTIRNINTTESSRSAKVDYVFSAQLIDAQTRKVIWNAKVDTSAWDTTKSESGYDSEYVSKFLSILLEQMTKDGLI